MRVYFLRHGIAADLGGRIASDAQRPLTAEGRRKTAEVARGMKALELGIDALFTSPLVRAVQTAEIAAAQLPGGLAPVEDDRLTPGSSPEPVLDLLRDLEGRFRAPLLVGHEPSLSSAVAWLLSGASFPIDFKKAGLAGIEFRGAPARGRGALLFFLPPSVTRGLQ